MLDYIRDAAEIYRQSFATIRAEADLSRFPDDVARVVVRLIHTCGQVDVAEHVAYSEDVVAKTHAAPPQARRCCAIRRWWRPGSPGPGCPPTTRWCRWSPTTGPPTWPPASAPPARPPRWSCGPTVSAGGAGDRQRADRPVPAAGTVDDGAPTPAAVLGGPVGFVGSAQSKQELIDRPRGMSYLVVTGRRGGSAMAAAAVNAIASSAE